MHHDGDSDLCVGDTPRGCLAQGAMLMHINHVDHPICQIAFFEFVCELTGAEHDLCVTLARGAYVDSYILGIKRKLLQIEDLQAETTLAMNKRGK